MENLVESEDFVGLEVIGGDITLVANTVRHFLFGS